jgi:hypothetical protein
LKKNKIEYIFIRIIFIKISTMFGFNHWCKVYPEQDAIKKTIPIIQFGFLFVERKRRKRNANILKMRTQTVEVDNIDLEP